VYFSSPSSQYVNFAIDEVSLRRITPEEDWEAAANEMIDEHRKGDVNVKVNVLGQSVFWNDKGFWPNWFTALSSDEKVEKMEKRAKDLVGRYKGKVNQWLVSRESIEKYTEDYDILTKMFNWTSAADSSADLVLSDRFAIQQPDYASAMVNQIKTLKAAGYSPQLDAQGTFLETNAVDPIRIA
ncbi:unnamed protein product, partial [Owenia fusiformis]